MPDPPPPRLPWNHRTRGYLCSFPITWTPYLGKRISKDIPPISGIVYRWQLQKTTPFPGFFREIFPRLRPPKYPFFPEKINWNAHVAPLCIRVGAPVPMNTLELLFLMAHCVYPSYSWIIIRVYASECHHVTWNMYTHVTFAVVVSELKATLVIHGVWPPRPRVVDRSRAPEWTVQEACPLSEHKIHNLPKRTM